MQVWLVFSTILTIITGVVLILKALPIPFFDRSGTTLMVPTEKGRVAVAKALAIVIGKPFATLNTNHVHRFLCKDGTSIDWLARPPTFKPLYDIVELKTMVIGFWRSFLTSPLQEALAIERILHSEGGYIVQIIRQPDPAVPQDRVVLILSDALMKTVGDVRYGSAFLIRYHAFRIRGPRPKIGNPF